MEGNRLVTIAYIFLGAGLLLFIWLLIRTAARMLGKTEGLSKFKSRFSGFIDFLFIFLGIIFILCSYLFFYLSSNLKYHEVVQGKTELGVVETFTRPDWDFKQGFTYIPQTSSGAGQSFSFELDGDSWYVLAERAEWPAWTRILGLATAYKVDGFYGGEGEPVVKDLVGKESYEIDGGESSILSSYDKFGGLFLGLKAETVQSKRRNFIPGRSYTIYADSTGLILQEMW